jgi:hypothetical protein
MSSYRWLITSGIGRQPKTRTTKQAPGMRAQPMLSHNDVRSLSDDAPVQGACTLKGKATPLAKPAGRVGPGAVRKQQRQAELEHELEMQRVRKLSDGERVHFLADDGGSASRAIGAGDGKASKKRVSYGDPRAEAELARLVNSPDHHSPSASGRPLF